MIVLVVHLVSYLMINLWFLKYMYQLYHCAENLDTLIRMISQQAQTQRQQLHV